MFKEIVRLTNELKEAQENLEHWKSVVNRATDFSGKGFTATFGLKALANGGDASRRGTVEIYLDPEEIDKIVNDKLAKAKATVERLTALLAEEESKYVLK